MSSDILGWMFGPKHPVTAWCGDCRGFRPYTYNKQTQTLICRHCGSTTGMVPSKSSGPPTAASMTPESIQQLRVRLNDARIKMDAAGKAYIQTPTDKSHLEAYAMARETFLKAQREYETLREEYMAKARRQSYGVRYGGLGRF